MQSFRFLPFVCSPIVGDHFTNKCYFRMGVSKGGGVVSTPFGCDFF